VKKPVVAKLAPRPKSRPKRKRDFNSMMLKTVEKLRDQPTPVAKPRPKKSFDQKMAALLKRPPAEAAQRAPLGQSLSASEIDAIRRQVERCWLVPTTIGTKDVQDMKVTLRLQLNPDGSLRNARIVDQFRYQTSSAYRAVAETALRAVRNPRCNRFRLPIEKYEIWKDIVMAFDASEMVGR